MRKRRESFFLLFLVGLLVLVSIASNSSPAYAGPAGEYDYVDNNLSDVDASADKGAHSNFTAQQYVPDSVYDVFTEHNTNSIVFEQVTVSSEQSTINTAWTDVPGAGVSFTPGSSNEEWLILVTADIRSSSTSENQARFRYDVNGVSQWGETGVQQGITSTSPIDPYNVYFHFSRITGVTSQQAVRFQFQASSGNTAYARNIHILCIRLDSAGLEYTEVNGDTSITGSQTLATLQFTPTSSGDYIIAYCALVSELPTGAGGAETWLDYDSGTSLYPDAWSTPNTRRIHADRDQFEPHGLFTKINLNTAQHAFRVQADLRAAGDTSTARDVRIAAFRVDAFDLLEFDEDTAVSSTTGANTVRSVVNTTNPGEQRNYLILAGIHTISDARSSREAGGIEIDEVFVQRKGDRKLSYAQIARIASHYAYVKTSSTSFKIETTYGTGGTGSDTIYSKQSVIYVLKIPKNYEIDLEVQWTNATHDLPNEELCIFGGTMGSEDIQVDVWNGSTWQNLFADLSSGWNNISVTDYLVNSIFTIRFKGGTETGDTSQDTWQIDCTLLHTWGVPPVANFSFSPEYPYQDDTVTFNASASYDPDGVIVSYFWDFGDGMNATGVIVNHAYADDGNYTVTLTVTDNHGLSDVTSTDVTVLNRPPIPIFTESAETVYTGEAITFNASDSYDPDGLIVSYFWDFGDGTNATGVTVEHAYADDGNYTVTLTVTDDDGGTDTATATKTVLNRFPVASFTESAETVYTGETIYFVASGSSDSDGTIITYFWNFGDGTNATGVTVDHAYVDNGNHTVTLTVTDDDGATDNATATKNVLNRPPVAVFTESAEIVYINETIYFNASDSYDLDGSIADYWWDFGDGTNATGVTTEHSYSQEGNYTVTLTLTDDDGATNSTSASKTVLNRPPVASFTESAETAYTGETITFDAGDSYDPDGTVISYFWDFGDGTNATGVIVEHSYLDDGNYTVTLTVTDDDGATDVTTATKTVLNRPPVASFTESAETVDTGETITFNASASYDPDGSIVSYFWDFGDGTNATGVIVDHSYVDAGVYNVTLTVTDDDGATDMATSTKTILNRPPVATFTESATTVFTGEVIYFDASGSYDPDGSIVSYLWDFGDGTNATGVVVDHAYAGDGNYTITLSVTDDDDATASTSATKTVLNRSPVAVFVESVETVYTNETITFDASDSYDPDGTVVSYHWDFGDGSNATGVVVDHAYAQDGNYTVTLTVTDDDNASSSSSATKTVLNRPPIALFTESAETVLTGEVITFNASDSYDLDGYVVGYYWDFGDGTNATGVFVEHAYVNDGIYNVTLKVTDDDGSTGTATSTKTALNRPPVALFTESATTVLTNEVIYFNASDSYDPDGPIVIYFWDFGDGTNATGVTVEHAYADDGNYTVTLTVTDDDNASSSSSATKTVLNRPPIALFTESAETVLTGEVITFNASDSYDLDGYIVSYYWDIGDGTNTTGVIVNHAYAEDGNYTVTLTVTDDNGATASTTATKTVLNRPPLAIFTESAEIVYTDEIIYLNASESYDPDGYIVGYFWDLGDGTNATGVTVEHAYTDDGNYTVTLTITDNDGASASASSTETVLNRPPVASFTESAETAYTGETITFDAGDSYDPDGTVISYFWDFGDGTNATGVSIGHSYADDGNYTVTLTITDNDGATGTATAIKIILNRSPVAMFTESATQVYTGTVIYFDASDSYDPDGLVVSYFWDFGDGTNATGVTAEHAYTDDGSYVVTLTVTDDDGATGVATATKKVLNRSPVASFTESAEIVYTSEVISFNASESYDPDGNIVSYFWDFGDSTNATGTIVDHAYSEDGNYTVTLTVTDDDGATASYSATKTVLNRPPIALFTESAETVLVSETIYFNASVSHDPDGYIVSYFWDFGDGTNATDVATQHAYADNGVYTVTLTITDNDGATTSATATKNVEVAPPIAIFTESAEIVYTGENITFNASSSYDPDGFIVSYFWNFGDGTNATDVTVEHAYADDGNYTVTLTVTDDDGAIGTATSTKTVLNKPPVAIFTESAETAYVGEPITFNATDSYDPDGTIVSYFWDFGDNTNATGVVIDHSYVDDGNYTVTLTVTDNDEAKASASAIKTVLNTAPVAIFTESAETVYTGEVIKLNASESYDPDGYIIDYFWDFGDGTNATGVTVEHAYVDDGNYTVILTVTDDDGATASALATKTILNRSPTALFTYSPDFPIAGETVTFDASGSYDPDGNIASYTWNFGDGNTTTVATPIVTHIYTTEENHTVTLTVTDNDGLAETATDTVRIRNYPTATFTYSPDRPVTGKTVTFDASLSSPNGGAITNYQWDFGDGNVTNVTTPIIAHIYSASGNYNVTLTATDSEGLSDSQSKMVEVGESPVGSFIYSPEPPYVGDLVAFNAMESYDPNGYIVSYWWDFGDGSLPANETNPTITHIYAASGNYTVTLIVTDNEGLNDTTTHIVTVSKAPVSVFAYSPDLPILGDIVTFNASESHDPNGYITNYTWDFGDGNVTTVTTPVITHIYATEGSYTVTLTVADNDDYTDTTTSIIAVRNYPAATFSYSPDYPIVGETATFDGSSSSPNGGVIVSYFWNLGDGSSPINTPDPIVTHIYSAAGNYTVTLTVTDSEGLSDFESKTVTVKERPVVAFTYTPPAPYVGDVMTFNASESFDPNGDIVSYWWNFGDGSPPINITAPLATHTYTVAGNYIVTLTVTDNEGLNATASKTVTVGKSPVASFTRLPTDRVEVGETVTFNASGSYDLNGYIVSYRWDFGDDNVTTVADPMISHVYTADYDWDYTVTLTVTDNEGYADTTTDIVPVRTKGTPVATFTYSPQFPNVGETVTFDASSSSPNGGTISLYEWDFGDGTTDHKIGLPTTTHQYVAPGEYTVTLKVTDSEDKSDTTSKTIKVGVHPGAIFTWSPQIPQVNETVTFDASASKPGWSETIVSYEWDFGDGNVTVVTNPVTTHHYNASGGYTVTLKVTNSEGLTDTATHIVTVGKSPVASFIYIPDFPIAGEDVSLNASGSYDPDGYIASYRWDFGDGNVTTVTTPVITHIYATEGSYTVTLTVTDNHGFADTTTDTLEVRNYPIAAFTYSPSNPFVGETVTFDASSSSPNGGTIIGYRWDFGDGNITTVPDQVIYHVYILDGNYTVTLNVTDSQGLWSSASKPINISPTCGPTADFIWDPSWPEPNHTVTFDASSSTPGWNGTHHPSVVSYNWDFGDGNITSVTDPTIDHVYTAEANYTVTLTVIDINGLEGNQTQTVMISIISPPRADIDGDGYVTIADLSFVAVRFGLSSEDEGWDPRADMDNDGFITIADVSYVATHFGEY